MKFLIIYLYLFLVTNTPISYTEASCIKIFTTKGNFESPNRDQLVSSPSALLKLNRTSNEIIKPNPKPIHCLYKFIGQEDERVVLNFTTFRLSGVEPECNQEYLDVYASLSSEDDLASVIGRQSSSGRFCSQLIPRRVISLHNMILLIFHSEHRPAAGKHKYPIFGGSFEFIKTKSHDQIGPPLHGSLCNHEIRSTEKRDGEFQSVTYPGVYVKGLSCSYKLIGLPKQRIRLEFLDLDLYSGGSHCPMDSVKVYDGLHETDPVIQTICGSHRSLIIYSTQENLLIVLTTMNREAEVQNRGFSAYFEFSDKFVDPGFIQGTDARHIRGSECDQRIISSRASTGLVRAPMAGHHTNAICRYIFEGLQTSLDYEKVTLKFKSFDLKQNQLVSVQNATSIAAQSTGVQIQQTQGNTTNTGSDQCTDNYVRLYTAELKPDQKQDPNDYDYSFCGSELPQAVESDAASLLMEFHSGSIEGASFEAEYKFVVDYRIPGFQNGSGCNYVYRSDSTRSGVFNSPRYPSWYINDLNCTYEFITKPNEFLLIQFITFKMAGSFGEKVLGRNEICQGHDRAEIFELDRSSMSGAHSNLNESYATAYQDQNHSNRFQMVGQERGTLNIGTFCGLTTPGPLMSYNPLKIDFISNKDKVHYGFSAIYNFHPISDLYTNEFVTDCGGHIVANQRDRSGNLSSPPTYRGETYEKRNHICTWNIIARPTHVIGLNFTEFKLEGSPYLRGCITASVKIITNRMQPPIELCGTWNEPPNLTSNYHFVSDSEWLSISFISTKLASGSTGFSATWFEIKK